MITFKKHQAPSTKLQTAVGKGWASGNRKPETGNLSSMIILIALIIFIDLKNLGDGDRRIKIR
jgi:hypothetical protein